jgi:hypothetical protein
MNWLIGHLVGDFIIQNDWMALNKKESTLHCTVHCLTYALCVWLFTLWPLWTIPVIFITHFALDRTKFVGWLMGIKGSKKFRDGGMAPWSWVSVDNTIHLVTLFLIEKLVNTQLIVF